MNNFCGLDFGTSNSSLGFVEDMAPKLTDFFGRAYIPSSVFFDFDDGPFFGGEAVKRYIDGKEGRMIWSPKNALGTKLVFDKTLVGRDSFAFTDIIGFIVRNIKAHAEQQARREFTSIVVGRPVYYNDRDKDLDVSAEAAMRTLLADVGFSHIEFAYEPIAAARHYQQSITDEEIALIVDMGGGTSDFTIAKLGAPKTKNEDEILSIGGVHIAGTNFDRHLSLSTVMPELGQDSNYKTIEGKWFKLPPTIHRDLATWHKIGFCYTKNNCNYVKQKIYSSDAPEKMQRLLQTLEQRLGHHVAMAVEQVKIALSSQDKALLSVPQLEPSLDIHIAKKDFENAIRDDVAKIHAALKTTIVDAKIDTAKISAVFMTGGASMVPIVRENILGALPHAKLIDGDKFGSVAAGLTLIAQEKFGDG